MGILLCHLYLRPVDKHRHGADNTQIIVKYKDTDVISVPYIIFITHNA